MPEEHDDVVWLTGTITDQTDAALKFERPGLPVVWVPKSQVVCEIMRDDLPAVGEPGRIPVTGWWAKTAGVHPDIKPARPGWQKVLATHRKLAWSRARSGLDDVRAILREEGDDDLTAAFVELAQRFIDEIEQLGVRL